MNDLEDRLSQLELAFAAHMRASADAMVGAMPGEDDVKTLAAWAEAYNSRYVFARPLAHPTDD